jgi:hypothetical protein
MVAMSWRWTVGPADASAAKTAAAATVSTRMVIRRMFGSSLNAKPRP